MCSNGEKSTAQSKQASADDGCGAGGGRGGKVTHILNPFVHKLEMTDVGDVILTTLMTIFVLPLRIVLMFLFLIVSWALASIGLFGLSREEKNEPLQGWRLKCRRLVGTAYRTMYWIGSFHRVKIIGRQATRNEAPILVAASHSSFFDTIAIIMNGPPSGVAKADSATVPFIGKLFDITQPIYVWRDDPDSRQNTIKAIIERAHSKKPWQQLIIFPEGTCTNRSCLISFKPGAFYPGLPIQPVCFRYPNKMDTVTWTWEGPHPAKLMWLTFTRLNTKMEMEFLPVYYPNEEEKANPLLFASNVRNVMAKALNIPVSDYTFNDCQLMARAKDMNVPNSADIVEIEMHRNTLNLHDIEERLVKKNAIKPSNCWVTFKEFTELLEIAPSPENASAHQQLYDIFDKDERQRIDMRQYLISALFIYKKDEMPIDFIEYVSMIHVSSDLIPGMMSKDTLHATLHCTLGLGREESNEIFRHIQRGDQDFIKFSHFKEYLRTRREYGHLFKAGKRSKKVVVEKKDN